MRITTPCKSMFCLLVALLPFAAACGRGQRTLQVEGVTVTVTPLRQHGWRPQFIRGDKKIAYWWGGPRVLDVQTKQVTRLDPRGITDDWDYTLAPVTYSQDGQRIYGSRGVLDGVSHGGLWVADLSTGTVEPALPPTLGGYDTGHIQFAWVSPDSRRVAWYHKTAEGRSGDLYLGETGQDKVKLLAHFAEPLHLGSALAWDATGGRVALTVHDVQTAPLLSQLWTADVQTGKLSQEGTGGFQPAFLGSGAIATNPSADEISVWDMTSQRTIKIALPPNLMAVAGGGLCGSEDGDALVFVSGTEEQPMLNLLSGLGPLVRPK
jgi:hypothetical protein